MAETLDHLDIVVTETCDDPDFLVTEPCDDPYKARPESDASDRAGRRPAWTRMRMPCRRTVRNPFSLEGTVAKFTDRDSLRWLEGVSGCR
jgi:hypothetical protein